MSFLSLSNELLLRTAHFLLTDQNDLYSLSLTNRTLSVIAQEALYRSPDLQKRHDSRKSKVIYFVHTLLKRPELADRVRSIHICISADHATHVHIECPRCRVRGSCKIHETAQLAARFTRTFWETRGGCDDGYFLTIEHGHEAAYAGVVLLLLTKLKELQFSYFGKYQEVITPAIPIGLRIAQTIFGHKDHEFDPSLIPGLQNLDYLRLNGKAPYEMITTNVKHFSIGLSLADPTPPGLSNLLAVWEPLRNVGQLDIRLDIRQLLYLGTPSSRIPSSPISANLWIIIMLQFSKLRGLRVHVEPQSDECMKTLRNERGSYAMIFGGNPYQPYPNLETLIIDHGPTAKMPIKAANFLDNAMPLPNLKRFPNLRYVSAPQNALMDPMLSYDQQLPNPDLDKPKLQSPLPPSVETIVVNEVRWTSILDWGNLVHDCYAGILGRGPEHGPSLLPNLKKIVIHGTGFGLEEDDQINANSVWTRLRKLGVAVEQGDYRCSPPLEASPFDKVLA